MKMIRVTQFDNGPQQSLCRIRDISSVHETSWDKYNNDEQYKEVYVRYLLFFTKKVKVKIKDETFTKKYATRIHLKNQDNLFVRESAADIHEFIRVAQSE